MEFNKGTDPDLNMTVELVVNDRAEAMVLHDKPFKKDLSWLEYNLNTSKLDFVMEDGDVKNFGIPVDPALAKYLQNAFNVLMVLMNETMDEPQEGSYLPLIIYRA